MTVKECEALKKGTIVTLNEGNGWYRKVTFCMLDTVTSFPKMTVEDLFNKNKFEAMLAKGRKERVALVQWVDDDGNRNQRYVKPRSINTEETFKW